MLLKLNEIRLALTVKDFNNKDENYVREEFLIPLFKAAGYDAFGTNYIARGINLKAYDGLEKGRRYIYPDFVLYKGNTPVWVIDAKTPKTTLYKKENFEQIKSYSFKLNCSNAILSNAKETFCINFNSNGTFNIDSVLLDDLLKANIWEKFIGKLRPEFYFIKKYDFSQVLDLYNNDNYIERSFIMDVLQRQPAQTIFDYLKAPVEYKLQSIRMRALPSIIIKPHINENVALFDKVLNQSLNDDSCIVRENFLTTIIPLSHQKLISIDKTIYDFTPTTFLEEFLFISFLSRTKIGRVKLVKYYSSNSFLKYYSLAVKKFRAASFPLALLLKKPEYFSYADYYYNINFLPGLIENLLKDPNLDQETLKVLRNCLNYGRKMNKSVFNILIRQSTKGRNTVITITWNYPGWKPGANVTFEKREGREFLITDKNATTKDNLDNSIDMSAFSY